MNLVLLMEAETGGLLFCAAQMDALTPLTLT